MRLRRLHLQQFRNIAFSSLDVDHPSVFFIGPNGQGKTNHLEAIGLLNALRSFRTHETTALIRNGQNEAQLRYEIEHEREGPCELRFALRSQVKEAWFGSEKLPRLGELIGRFPTVALCAEDIQLVRGTPALRRRFFDMTLCAETPYLDALRRYHRALRHRNALLKEPRPDTTALTSFEAQMAPAATQIVQTRHNRLAELARHLSATYTAIATEDEAPRLNYLPDRNQIDAETLARYWHEQRPRDLAAKTTRHGPHRDDFALTLQGQPARTFGSEGQQRSLVLALKLAQANYLREHSGVHPILLADDILGQLDPQRQARFWQTLAPEHQVFATGTVLPHERPHLPWQVFNLS